MVPEIANALTPPGMWSNDGLAVESPKPTAVPFQAGNCAGSPQPVPPT